MTEASKLLSSDRGRPSAGGILNNFEQLGTPSQLPAIKSPGWYCTIAYQHPSRKAGRHFCRQGMRCRHARLRRWDVAPAGEPRQALSTAGTNRGEFFDT